MPAMRWAMHSGDLARIRRGTGQGTGHPANSSCPFRGLHVTRSRQSGCNPGLRDHFLYLARIGHGDHATPHAHALRSEEHTFELQYLMLKSYDVFLLKTSNKN